MAKLELSDNAFGAVVVICVAVMCLGMAHCEAQRSQGYSEVNKARIAAGYCENSWGTWSKCQ